MRWKRLSSLLFRVTPVLAAGLVAAACGGDSGGSTGPSSRGSGIGAPQLSMATIITPKAAATIGSPTGDPEYAAAANVGGLVVGWLGDPANGRSQATTWSNGVPASLPALPNAGISAANDVNASGVIVGLSDQGDGIPHPVRWTNGTIQDLGVAQGYVGGVAKAINSNGVIVGWMLRPDGSSRAFRYVNGAWAPIPIPEPFYANQANDVNDNGIVVGWTLYQVPVPGSPPPADRVFTYDPSNASTDFPAPLGGSASRALAINNDGYVTGWTVLGDGKHHGVRFHWVNGGGVDLGTVVDGGEVYGMGINADGAVVGRIESIDPNTGSPRVDAFLWQQGNGMQRLKSLGTGGTLPDLAAAMTDGGDIYGWSFNNNGVRRAVIWSPKSVDTDGDGITDDKDNCPTVWNPDQDKSACKGEMPTVVLDVPSSPAEGAEKKYKAIVKDPEGKKMDYSWDFGDGTIVTGTIARGDTLASDKHTYVDNAPGGGAYRLIFTVNDGTYTVADTTLIDVDNVVPKLTMGPNVSIPQRSVHNLSASFTDPGVLDGPWQVTIYWGDGGKPQKLSMSAPGPIVASHAYNRVGTYPLQVTVIDKDGDVGSGQYTVTVTR